jgi:hypothetical protein
VKVRLHSTGDASPLAALLLPQILPDILGRRALPSGRLAGLGATPGLPPRAASLRAATLAITSLTFMFVLVPDPVWKIFEARFTKAY